MADIQHLKSLSVVQADFDIWSGQTRLSASDLTLGEGGKIPPEKIAQLGSKKICDPAKLKGFHRLKSETRRLLSRYGMPFMNGFAVPVDKVDEICDKLNAISAEFNTLKQNFISDYDNAVEEWVNDNPEYEGAIRAGAIPRAAVERRIGFDYQLFMIQPVDNNEANTRRLNTKIEQLGDDLISEVVHEANKFYAERLAGRDQCGISTRITLRNIRDKVDGLSFLNSAFDPLVKLLDQTLEGYKRHAQGRNIVAPFFYQVMSATLIMCERSKIEQYADGSLSLEGVKNSLPTAQHNWGYMMDAAHRHESDPINDLDDGSSGPESGQSEEAGSPAQAPTAKADSAKEMQEEARLEEDIDSFFEQFLVEDEAAPIDGSKGTEEPAQEEAENKQPEILQEPSGAPRHIEPALEMPQYEDSDQDCFF